MAVQTVRGLIGASESGHFHAHEHIFMAEGPHTQINPALRIDDFEKSCEELLGFRSIGGSTLVDAQPIGCGRMAEALWEASLKTNVNIVASTGFHKSFYYDESHWLFSMDTDALAHLFSQEIMQGMYVGADAALPSRSINARAGVIKTAIDEERLHNPDKGWFVAAAKASIDTGAPILCHTESTEQGQFLAEFYLEQGVRPDNIILCHLDRSLANIPAHRIIAALGVYLEYDTIGRFKYHDDEGEIRLLRQMIDWGYGSSILLGLDTTRERLLSYGGTIGLTYLSREFIPLMKARNIPQQDIDGMLTSNPFRAFSIKA